MDEKLIKTSKKLLLCFIVLLLILVPTSVKATSASEKLSPQEEAKKYESDNHIVGEIIDFSSLDFSDNKTITSANLSTQNGSDFGRYTITKEGKNYTITLENVVAKKIILPADDADMAGTVDEKGEQILKAPAYTGAPRQTHITIILKGYNKVTGYGIEGYPVKGIKITGNGSLEVNAFSEPKVRTVNKKVGGDWKKVEEIDYYTKSGISVETGDLKYNDYLQNPDKENDDRSLVFASTGKIKINAPKHYGIVNNGNIKFESGNIEIESKKSAISGYGILVEGKSDKLNLELKSDDKAFYDKPTFSGNDYYIMASKKSKDNAEPISKEEMEKSYASYGYMKIEYAEDQEEPQITVESKRQYQTQYIEEDGEQVEVQKIYCELPTITVKDDVAIESVYMNGAKVTNFTLNTKNEKKFVVYNPFTIQKEIVVKDVMGKTSKVSFMAYNTHKLAKAESDEYIEPTCTTEGFRTNKYYCTICEELVKTEKIMYKALGHSFNEWEEKEDYTRERKCSVCGYTETEDLSKEIYNTSISLLTSKYVYDGNKKEPEVLIKDGNKELSEGKDYIVSYSNNLSAGTAKVLITGMNGYKDTVNKSFTIERANNSITASNFTKTYSANAQSFSIGAKQKGDAKLAYSSNNKNVTVNSSGKVTIAKGFVGKATITITANATTQYNKTTKQITVTVNKANNSITASNFTKTYSANTQSFSIGAKQKGNAKLTYSSNNKNVTVNSSGKVTIAKGFVGKATITITANATNQYNKATKQITITVNPAKVSISGLSNSSSKKMTIKWNKSAQVTGYQIQYSTDKNFKKDVKTITVNNKQTVSKTISNLTKNKQYYVHIRTYKTVSGVNYYSGWSASKNITIKK